jgi:hypothetical protein
VLPDHPEQPPLHQLKTLLSVLAQYAWANGSAAPVTVYTHVLALLAALAQPKYLYGVRHVEGNDALYGNAPKFVDVVAELAEEVLELALQALRGVLPEQRRAPLAATLMETLASTADLTRPKMAQTVGNLFRLAQGAGLSSTLHTSARVCLTRLAQEQAPGAEALRVALFG